ncbi:FAD-dependent oxidoreductase [Catenuloplanes sp. NPDC051500]|uniref:FAD-dependent oxidoreductase n=1 Tax=Catenuloplanes sp. NPDC051500 TaxID=3363959 RepID=UPI00379DEA9C
MQVTIVGAGIAGSATAIGLSALGHQVTVCEAGPAVATGGSFISLATNALRALDVLGVPELPVGFPVARQRMWTASGRLLGDVARGRRASDPTLSITAPRAGLVNALRDRCRAAGATIWPGSRVAGLSDDLLGVRLADETILESDLIVAADGLRSPIRAALDPASAEPVYAGLYTVAGTSALDLPRDSARDSAFNMTICRNGAFIHLRAPDGAIWWQAQINGALAALDVSEAFADAAVPSAIIAAATSVDRPQPHHLLDPAPSVWTSSRVALLGDALHPIGAGQGAAMALEDAAALTGAVRGASTVEAALAVYEAVRRPRIAKVLRTADDNRNLKAAGSLSRTLQGLIMPLVLRHGYERATGWLYDYEPAV